jgi:hypothetical protein
MRTVTLIGSDGDDKIIGPIDNMIAAGDLEGKRNRCFWHLNEQQYTNNVETHASKEEKQVVHTPVRHTLSMISSSAESLSDIADGFDAIRVHLNQLAVDNQYSASRIKTAQEHCDHLQSLKHLWVKCMLGERTFGCNMSCRIEGEQHRLKVHLRYNVYQLLGKFMFCLALERPNCTLKSTA